MKKSIDLSNIPEEELLELRICDLPIKISGSWLEACIDELYKELDSKGILFKPFCYLADEWLSPDNEPIIGLPFYLAHPALVKLEKKFMLDVEGSTKPWCMKLLRHEAGHAINYAYKLYKRRKWKEVFGSFQEEYAETYRFRPYSRSFVKHLEDYYAQYHPDEDFAETFAVWLAPNFDWEIQYRGWKALSKLRYVDSLMREISSKEPLLKRGKKYWQASRMKITLMNFYKKKRRDYREDFPDFHDINLKKIFQAQPHNSKNQKASEILKRYRKEILSSVSAWTGEKKYIIDDLMRKLICRCRGLRLETDDNEPVTVLKISAYITTLVMNYLHTGWFGGDR
ncbi:MAG: hypothetical protein ABH872_06975 [Candidatus Omnitrophota bacterium]